MGNSKQLQILASSLPSFSTLNYNSPKLAKTLVWSKQPIDYEQMITFSNSNASQGGQSVNLINNAQTTGILFSDQIVDLFEKHAQFRNTAGAGANVTVDGNYSAGEYNSIYIKSATVTYTMTNQSPVTTDVDMYIITPKNSKYTYSADQALTHWDNGIAASAMTNTVATKTFYGTSPTLSKEFNMNWKIVKRISLRLEPGQEHTHIFKFNVRRLVDLGHCTTFAGGIKGIAMDTILITKGPVLDSTNGFTSGSISTSRTKIVGVQKVKYRAYAVQNYPKITYQATNITTGNANLYGIVDASGTVVNTETATNYA